MKKERFKITPYRNPSGKKVYRVIGYMPQAGQIRKNFKTYEEALGYKQELEIRALNTGQQSRLLPTRLSEEQLREAETAFVRLGNGSMLEAVDYYLRHQPFRIRPKLLAAAVQEFLENRQFEKRVRTRTLKDYRSRLAGLLCVHGHRQVHEITTDDLKPLVYQSELSSLTITGNLRVLNTFFAWCQGQKFCPRNPAVDLERPRQDQQEPSILTLPQVIKLLESAHEYESGKLIPYIVLSLFAGLRHGEMERLKWKHIDLDQAVIRVDGSITKCRQRRVIEMSENLASWLRAYRGFPLLGSNWRRDFQAVRMKADLYKSSGKKGKSAWQPDILRHTALSYHFAKTVNDQQTAQWAGNSPEVLHRHYRGLVTQKDSDQYWSLMPEAFQSKA